MELYRKKDRLFEFFINGKDVNTPFFYPAISSVKTNYGVEEYLKFFEKFYYPSFLISSYDIYNIRKNKKLSIYKYISQFTDQGMITLLDNGNYEASWYNDKEWNFKKFEEVLDNLSVDFCFSFDVFLNNKESMSEHIKKTIKSILMTSGAQRSGVTIPLLHSNPRDFPKFARKIIENINPEIIGIPERELGSSIFERAKTVKKIREEIDKTRREVPIHLLGTGNPISILVYTICGADLYDGLEWCQTVVNPETGQLFHFVQRDIIDCDCEACNANSGIPYHLQTMAHNLIFYEKFMKKIRLFIESGQIEELLREYLKPKYVEKTLQIAGLR